MQSDRALGERANQGLSLMIKSFYALSSAAVFLSSTALAQTTAPIMPQPKPIVTTAPAVQPAQASPPAQPMQMTGVLRAGTPIALKMSEGLTTEGKKLRVGYRFQMEVAEPVMVNGQTVVPAGSPATGEVTDVRNKGMWGKSGGINARALFVRANGQQIRLTGQMDDKGTTGTAAVVGALVVIPVAGFFVTGTSARIPIGAPVSAFIDEDVPVAFAQAAAPTPMMVVPVAAPPAPLAPAPAPAVSAPAPTAPQKPVKPL